MRVTISYLFLSTLLLSSEQFSQAFEGVVWNVGAPDSGSLQLILFTHGSHVYKRVNFMITLRSGLSVAVRRQREQAVVRTDHRTPILSLGPGSSRALFQLYGAISFSRLPCFILFAFLYPLLLLAVIELFK